MLVDDNESKEERHDTGGFKPGDVVAFTDAMPRVPGVAPGNLAVVHQVGRGEDAPFPISVNIVRDGHSTILGLPVLAKEIRLVNRSGRLKLRKRFPWL